MLARCWRRVALLAAAAPVLAFVGAYGFIAVRSLDNPGPLTLGEPAPATLESCRDGVWATGGARLEVLGGWLVAARLNRFRLVEPVEVARLALREPFEIRAHGRAGAVARLELVLEGPAMKVRGSVGGEPISLRLTRRGSPGC